MSRYTPNHYGNVLDNLTGLTHGVNDVSMADALNAASSLTARIATLERIVAGLRDAILEDVEAWSTTEVDVLILQLSADPH